MSFVGISRLGFRVRERARRTAKQSDIESKIVLPRTKRRLQPRALSLHHGRFGVLAIKEQGLLPSIEEAFAPSDPVVWLPEQPDVTLDHQTAAAVAHVWGQYEAPPRRASSLTEWRRRLDARPHDAMEVRQAGRAALFRA